MSARVTPGRRARKSHRQLARPPFECIALLLQGGGALGAYQAGVYEALSEAHLAPDWVAGISIGAVNAALIAGNPPTARVEKLREFWKLITAGGPWDGIARFAMAPSIVRNEFARGLLNQLSAGTALLGGTAGFFAPRVASAWLQPPGSIEATSYYDTAPLKATLERLVDFDRINAGETRFSIGAVNVTTGNFLYFDNTTHTIGAEHVMASGA
ncbi:MAG TPA: patatin-like phospholipase family protein, partial [Steroidobacteraceae bacterium]|nr:patatin-like phospholipase family protein [Steroidobacteraceae bacterium]